MPLVFQNTVCYNDATMANTISVNAKTVNIILTRLDKLAKDVQAIKARVLEEEPSYGSDAWWEWSDRKAIEDIKAGKGKQFTSAQDAIKWLKS